MKKIFQFFFNRWTLAILGLVAISLLIWYIGPLIAVADFRPLESNTMRIICIALIVGFYIGKLAWRFIKANKLNTRLMDGLLRKEPSQPKPEDSADADKVAVLHKRFEEAVKMLKHANPSGNTKKPLLSRLIHRQYLYELPWYIFIGAPGSGKTTAVKNSGLQFALAERFGSKAVCGIGGTRDCDWWFTDEAIFLDTAGRYTSQDSNQRIDSAEWIGFLQLLKKYRPGCPINGVIVTVGVDDLLEKTPAERTAQANELRKRIQELHAELNIRFPLYVLVTKVDRLTGFMEFFSEFGKEERSQVWGTTFPLSEKQDSFPLTNFSTEFSVLEQRLNDRLIDYLQKERNLQKRALLYTFPQQFSGLKEILGDYLNQVFSPSRYDQQPLLRGIYFTSGTQQGNLIDRVISNLAQALHLEVKLPALNDSNTKSFFLSRLIKKVIVSEAGLAGTNLRWERQQRSLQLGGFFLAALLTCSVAIAWAISYSRNKAYVTDVETKISAVSKQVSDLPSIQNLDIPSLLGALKSVQEFTKVPTLDSNAAPLSMGFGLYQGDKLSAASNKTYQRLLQNAFLPKLVFRIESLLSNADVDNLELLYEGLKAYLMLHDMNNFDPIALKTFIITDWEINLPREISNEQRKELESHLDNLLSHGQLSSPVPINTQLIEKARKIIDGTPIARRIYNRLKLQGIGAEIPEFTITKAAGPAASLVFADPVSKEIPGLFSRDGYYTSFTKASKEVTKQLAEEEIWVLGKSTNFQAETELNEKVRRLYLDDYRDIWDTFINDIRLIRANSLQDSIILTRLLSATDSPLPALLSAIVEEVTLVNTDETDKSLVDRATNKILRSTRETLRKILDQDQKKTSTLEMLFRPENVVDNHFTKLRSIVRPAPGQPAQIDAILEEIGELHTQLAATEIALKSDTEPPPSDIYARIRERATDAPEPIRSILMTLLSRGISQAQEENRENINQSLRPNVTEFCRKAISGRYPFTKESNRDVTQDDFAQLFAPGGLLDKFFQNNLSQYVDTTMRPWRFRQVESANIDTTSRDLQEFYRAEIIRDVFFHSDNSAAGIKLTFKPIDMNASITKFILDIDGQQLEYAHDPQRPVSIQWPGPGGSSQISLQIFPADPEGKSRKVFEGPWALFRMLDLMQVDSSADPEKFLITFKIGERTIQYEMITSSVMNPFRLREIVEQFNCPVRL